MTCGVYDIYLKFGSFNGIDPIVPKIKWERGTEAQSRQMVVRRKA
jgi:hypothetical protein